MSYQRLEQTLVWIIKISLYLIAFTPLLLSASYFFPTIFPKVVYLRLLIEVAVIAYIPLLIIAPHFRPRYHAIYVSLAVFAAIVLLTSITGENFSYSFWGNYERMDGVFSWLHYWALIVIAPSVFKTKKEWLRLFGLALLTAFLLASYGFLQRFGVSQFGPLTIYETNLGRITGTIGNPAFLAAYLLFNFVFGLLIVLEQSLGRWWRIAAGAALVPVGAAYLMTGVRGAFVGLVAGVVVFFVGNLFWSTSRRARRIVAQGFFGFVVALAVLYSLVNQNQWVNDNFGRFFSIALQDSTVQTRLISWRGAISGFKDNFWLGVGPQKFDIIFNRYFDPKFYELVGNETWWDRAHNIVFEVAGTMGIVGLLSYFAVGAALFLSLRQIGQDENYRQESLIIASLAVAYFIQNLFIFDTVSSYLSLSLLLAYVISRDDSLTPIGERIKQACLAATALVREAAPRLPAKRWWVALVLAGALIAPVAYAGNLKLIGHNRLFFQTITGSQTQSFRETLADYKKVFSLSNFDNREVAIKLAQYSAQRALAGRLSTSEFDLGYAFVNEVMDQIVNQNPKDVRLLLSYGNALNIFGEMAKGDDPQRSQAALLKAEEILLAAVSFSPTRQQVFYSLANSYLILGERQRGIETFIEAADIYPDNPKTYWLLAIVYAQEGQADLARQEMDLALDKNYRFGGARELGALVALLVAEKDWNRLLRLYKTVAAQVRTGDAQAKVAAVLAQMGRREEAIAAAREVLELNPAAKDEVDNFIKKIESGRPTNFILQ